MKSSTAALQIKNSLNKLDSNDYKNIALWKIQESVNVAVQRFVRERLPYKEANNLMVEDIQVLLKHDKLAGSNRKVYFMSSKLPKDYFGLSRISAICSKEFCKNVMLPSTWVEDSQVNDLLNNSTTQPSFDFEQTFHVLGDNRVYQYHNNDFEVEWLDISYYKKPKYIEFPGSPLPEGGLGKDMEWEFKDDVADKIIEQAVQILAGNTENINRFQIAEQAKK